MGNLLAANPSNTSACYVWHINDHCSAKEGRLETDMNLKELDDNLNSIVASFLIWLNCVRAPFATCKAILDSDLSDDKKLSHAMRLWLVSAVIALVIELPVYRLVGIEWNNVGFYIPNCLFLLFILIISVGILHLGLRIFKIPSEFTQTFVVYTVIVGCFSPIFTLLFAPSLIEELSILKSLKPLGLTFEDIIAQWFARLSNMNNKSLFMQGYDAIISPITSIVSVMLLVIFQRYVSAVYNVERYRAISAIGFSVGILLPIPVIILSTFYYFVIYTSL